ncbi:TIGR00341 family protein [Paraoerskovia marina]|uniref:TIGR00341 family protein n=1 Tax=Paraoerskovia marina TaxID=545619 RepID=A0A1H1MCN2_9CELL|nr:TIGR00341 family protein [Paraoerskovia marina]SDR84486.1 TIGR00341 family protein [Paraoerskovia marina]
MTAATSAPATPYDPKKKPGYRLGSLVPPEQRRGLAELSDRLDLDSGDVRAKRSAFWAMLILSGVIATAGIVTDSTATVIGAMIIAPLSTPILGIGVGIVTARPRLVGRSLSYVAVGLLLVVALGTVTALILPNTASVLQNSQVTGRTSPGVMDLIAAFATGFAGSIALARKDLGDVLPGIAIAISLVPPLGVVGVCLGAGEPSLAAGALLLFGSNVVALVIASTVVFFIAGYGREAVQVRRELEVERPRRRRAFTVIAVAFVIVAIPMVGNTVTATLASVWAGQVRTATEEWVADTPGATVENVSWQSRDLMVEVRSPGALPDVDDLQDTVDELIPWSPEVVVLHTVGERVERASE